MICVACTCEWLGGLGSVLAKIGYRMRILVIGGNGFIGSHLVDNLIASGHKVRVFDRSPERYRPPLTGVEYLLANFGDTSLLSEALEGVDLVYHLVSTTVPSTSNRDPLADIESNLMGTVRLLQLMQQQSVKRIVFLSSGGTVYGVPESDLVSEQHAPKPVCSYGVVKLAIENYLHMFHHLYGIEYLCLRVSNPYGPRQGHLGVQGVIGTFLSNVKEGTKVQIWGDGSVVRDYIYVGDLATLCAQVVTFTGSGVFNVGSGRGTSLLEIVQTIGRVSKRSITPSFLQKRNYDIPRIVLDIRKVTSTFGWVPRVDLEKGIELTFDWLMSVD